MNLIQVHLNFISSSFKLYWNFRPFCVLAIIWKFLAFYRASPPPCRQVPAEKLVLFVKIFCHFRINYKAINTYASSEIISDYTLLTSKWSFNFMQHLIFHVHIISRKPARSFTTWKTNEKIFNSTSFTTAHQFHDITLLIYHGLNHKVQ